MVAPTPAQPVPQGAQGVYIGGGFPELYARELSENKSTARPRPKKWSQAQTDRLCEYFYTAGEKTDYILIIFNYYRKVYSTTVLTSRGTTFWGEVAPEICSQFASF